MLTLEPFTIGLSAIVILALVIWVGLAVVIWVGGAPESKGNLVTEGELNSSEELEGEKVEFRRAG